MGKRRIPRVEAATPRTLRGSIVEIRDMVLEALNGWLTHTVRDWSVDVGAGAYLIRVKR